MNNHKEELQQHLNTLLYNSPCCPTVEDNIYKRKLHFGCGTLIKEGFDNVDIQEHEGIKSFDFERFPYPIRDDTYDYVFSRSVLEHLYNPDKVLIELWRICKNGAIIEIIVPSYNNRAAYDGIEHKHYFSSRCFEYFVNDVDSINKKKYFEIDFIEDVPTNIGSFMPKKLREKLSLFLFGITSYVHVKLKVVK